MMSCERMKMWQIYFFLVKSLCLALQPAQFVGFLGILHSIATNTARQLRYMDMDQRTVPLWYRIFYRYKRYKLRNRLSSILTTIQKEAEECNSIVYGSHGCVINPLKNAEDDPELKARWEQQRAFASQLVELSTTNMVIIAWHLSFQQGQRRHSRHSQTTPSTD